LKTEYAPSPIKLKVTTPKTIVVTTRRMPDQFESSFGAAPHWGLPLSGLIGMARP